MLFIVLLIAMAAAGAASLGFLGMALAAIADATPGVNEAYSAGAVEWFVQLGGALLSSYAGTVSTRLNVFDGLPPGPPKCFYREIHSVPKRFPSFTYLALSFFN